MAARVGYEIELFRETPTRDRRMDLTRLCNLILFANKEFQDKKR